MERSAQPPVVQVTIGDAWDFTFSNFAPCVVKDEYGIKYPTIEHAYQACKSTDVQVRQLIAGMERPGQAKRAGQQLEMRPEWEAIKYAVMMNLIRQKYQLWTKYGRSLIASGPMRLVEVNNWHDNIWGNCLCDRPSCQAPGENWLGRLLMLRRSELVMEVALK